MENTSVVKLVKGISALLISMFFLTGMVLALTEMQFSTGEYIFAYIFSSIVGIMIVTMLLFTVTCLSSLIIIPVDRKFSMRNLFCVIYNYYGKTIMLNMILIYIYYQEWKISAGIVGSIYVIFSLIFMFQYYKGVITCAYVHKTAAKLLVGVTLVINLMVVLSRVMEYI